MDLLKKAKKADELMSQSIDEAHEVMQEIFRIFPNGVSMYNNIEPMGKYAARMPSLYHKGIEYKLLGTGPKCVAVVDIDADSKQVIHLPELTANNLIEVAIQMAEFLTPETPQQDELIISDTAYGGLGSIA